MSEIGKGLLGGEFGLHSLAIGQNGKSCGRNEDKPRAGSEHGQLDGPGQMAPRAGAGGWGGAGKVKGSRQGTMGLPNRTGWRVPAMPIPVRRTGCGETEKQGRILKGGSRRIVSSMPSTLSGSGISGSANSEAVVEDSRLCSVAIATGSGLLAAMMLCVLPSCGCCAACLVCTL